MEQIKDKVTTLRIHASTRQKIFEHKMHYNESEEQVILKLMKFYDSHQKPKPKPSEPKIPVDSIVSPIPGDSHVSRYS